MWRSLRCCICLGFLGVLGCAGSGVGPATSNPTPSPTLAGTTVTVVNLPASAQVAGKSGSGSFTPLSVQNGQASFIVPNGSTKYSIAFFLSDLSDGLSGLSEVVIQATIQDTTLLDCSSGCFGAVTPVSIGSATGSADASLMAGAANISIFGKSRII